MPWGRDIVGGGSGSKTTATLHSDPLTPVKLAKMIGILVRVN